jgi:hypothetical protein
MSGDEASWDISPSEEQALRVRGMELFAQYMELDARIEEANAKGDSELATELKRQRDETLRKWDSLIEELKSRLKAFDEEIDSHLLTSEAYWSTADNPLYAWGAIHVLALDEPLPAWVRAYLKRAAADLWAIALRHKGDPKRSLDHVPGALGLSAHSWNAFKALADVETYVRVAHEYEEAAANRKAVVAALAVKHRVTERQVFRWLREAKKMMEAERLLTNEEAQECQENNVASEP